MWNFKREAYKTYNPDAVPAPEYSLFGNYRKDNPCGVDYDIYVKASDGLFYYLDGVDYVIVINPSTWFQYDRPEGEEWIWTEIVFNGDYVFAGAEQSSTCAP